ncbi:hypothetical protein EMIHUDRAFT_217797 [Emiliania huxleyi CCMP1516]|uniref:Bromodomain associated domain-containing protein n=2 Tax=Emiliania huxleyi TaxID=2903 RepID=A0A0D3IAC4_EMIH1|nr:hypothetical protein EMIHUDRAFT_217797 [Emiliania huxleyi CCMP1516]EOD08209.1 hypothetical protein EMIHUDRAFT_217797 [Emiliania huxleyi CCMP1516]|eukprot:XP_005760638.1 hypothetical protein EMIHUDRAFT_217797 [Emiliania huxleyi CCMP1516]
MSLPASALEPFADADVDEEEAAGIAMDSRALADAASLLLPELEEPSTSGASGVAEAESAAGAALTSQLALRVLRDAIGLQLARRGFDGLRANPLSLVAEMAAHFIGGLGVQLQLVAPPRTASPERRPDPMVPYVNAMAGNSLLQLVRQKQPCLGGSPPPAVLQLYTALRATWHYKMTPQGRTAHTQAGHADGANRAAVEPNALQAALAPSELCHVVSLSAKARRTADAWLSGQPGGGGGAPPPTLFPGPLLARIARCSAVKKGLRVEGSGVVSLPHLISVSGDVMVTNTALSKIKMESLTTVGGFVDISENAKLTDIEMENLIYIGGDLNVDENESLTFLEMKSLAYVGRDLTVNSNPLLTSVETESLTTVYGDLIVDYNPELGYLELDSLDSVGKNFVVHNNNPDPQRCAIGILSHDCNERCECNPIEERSDSF